MYLSYAKCFASLKVLYPEHDNNIVVAVLRNQIPGQIYMVVKEWFEYNYEFTFCNCLRKRAYILRKQDDGVTLTKTFNHGFPCERPMLHGPFSHLS